MSQTEAPREVEHPFSEVFQAEVDELRTRRGQCLPHEFGLPEGQDAPAGPSTKLGLVGLALSGGGIRSGSFSLGVVQKLARERLFKSIDYLSTVSGGGYLGASLSSLLSASGEQALEPERFPLRKEEGKPEPPALSHLRNGSNYLNPPGLLNLLGLPIVLLRGFLLTLVSVLPSILAAVALTELFYEMINPFLCSHGIDIDVTTMDWSFPAAVGTFVLLAVFFPFSLVLLRPWMSLRSRSAYQKTMAGVLLLILMLFVLRPIMMLVNLAAYLTPQQAGELLDKHVWPVLDSPALWAALLIPPILLAVFRFGRKVLKVLGTVLAAVSGPLALFAVYIALCLWQVNPPRQINLDDDAMQGLKKNGFDHVAKRAFDPLPEAHHLGPVAHGLRRGELFQDFHDVTLDGTTLHVGWREDAHAAMVWGTPFDAKGLAFLALTALLLLINYRFLNINFTSPHTFYRDQLSRVFLLKEDGDRVLPNDALKLSALRGGKDALSCAPYHLINGTVNLDSDKDYALRGRNGAVFIFSKLYVGSQQTGWCRTEKLEKVDPHLDLGTAMSISAAAASTNMGTYTSRAFSFLLMLLNIRLGYWLPNPAFLQRSASFWSRRPFWGAGPRYLLKEALGPLESRDRYVNVSDGGHLENLGLYELLRRRCKLIIAVDGEADPDMRFNGLVTLLRYAGIDLGVRIDIDLGKLRKTDGLSQAHWARGVIDYGGGETGELFYIKASLTGDENPYIRAYREANPAFPHESTADQFFSETQLEAYRALGEHATTALVGELSKRLPVRPSAIPEAVELRSKVEQGAERAI